MANMLDLSEDWAYWEDLEVVTYEAALRGQNEPDVVLQAKRRASVDRERSPSGGVYIGNEVDWHIPDPLLTPNLIPKQADVIIDSDGTRWTVLTTLHKIERARWRLGTVDLVLANQLTDTITVERPEIHPDAAGVNVKVFPTSPALLPGHTPAGAGKITYRGPARVQLLTEQIKEERGIRGSEYRYDIIVAHLPREGINTEDRIRWIRSGQEVPHTLYFDVLGVRNPTRIDELPVIECLRKV